MRKLWIGKKTQEMTMSFRYFRQNTNVSCATLTQRQLFTPNKTFYEVGVIEAIGMVELAGATNSASSGGTFEDSAEPSESGAE